MWMTSAPQAASSAPATGTNTHCASSTTRTPAKGLSCASVTSSTSRVHEPPAVHLGRFAAGNGGYELDGLRHLVGGQPALGVGDDLVGRRRHGGVASLHEGVHPST